MYKIVVTGPESTGKTELAKKLADHYNGVFIPEYAREYVTSLDRKYSVYDVKKIAKNQLTQYEGNLYLDKPVFFDTWLIITKIWLEVVFDTRESWIDNAIKNSRIDLYLLCDADLPWVPDEVRENGGVMREKLFNLYRKVLEDYNLEYRIINGIGKERINNAIFTLNNVLNIQ